MLIAVQDLPGFTKFMEEIFGAKVSVRNNGENIVMMLSSGLITGTQNGVFYTLSGDRELIKNITNLWQTALSAVQNQESASTSTPTNEDENGQN